MKIKSIYFFLTELNHRESKQFLPFQRLDNEASDKSELMIVLKFVALLITTLPSRLNPFLALSALDQTHAFNY